jgi:hypothetical protein
MKSLTVSTWILGLGLLAGLCAAATPAWSQTKGEKTFQATLTDAQGVETEVKNVIFYWEEKISETAFVPHELKQIPVKRGTTTVNVKFDTIKVIDVKPGANSPWRSTANSRATPISARSNCRPAASRRSHSNDRAPVPQHGSFKDAPLPSAPIHFPERFP